MGFADVMIDANDAALERREVAFDRVAVRGAAHVFVSAMIDHFMAGKLLAHAHVVASRIRHQRGLAAHMRNNQRAERLTADVGNVMRTGLAAALYQRMNNAADLLAASTTLPWPPSGPAFARVIASRIRCIMNQAVLYVTPSRRCT